MRRRYSDEERANALAALQANGGNVKHTATQLGIPEITLRQWAKGTRHPEALQMKDGKLPDLADQLEDVAYKLVGAMPKKIAKATLQQCAVSLGIAVEKMRLLREQPTGISRNELPIDLKKLTDEQLAQLDAILAAAGLPPADRTRTV